MQLFPRYNDCPYLVRKLYQRNYAYILRWVLESCYPKFDCYQMFFGHTYIHTDMYTNVHLLLQNAWPYLECDRRLRFDYYETWRASFRDTGVTTT